MSSDAVRRPIRIAASSDEEEEDEGPEGAERTWTAPGWVRRAAPDRYATVDGSEEWRKAAAQAKEELEEFQNESRF